MAGLLRLRLPFVTGLLRVKRQFRSHFADVLRVLRLQRGGYAYPYRPGFSHLPSNPFK
jgi:hypothetical protein